MPESRHYTALDWVTGEINETLTQARMALEAYVANPDDQTQIRFCLTYLHQVYGILQMVEFHGGSLLAEELEKLAQAIVDNRVGKTQAAYEVLMRAILQLPVYLDRVKSARHDDPSSLMPLLNDLRAIRGEPLLTETALFSPNMAAARNVKGPRANISDEKFADAVKKMRQMYQQALVSIIKDKDYDSNLPVLEKIFSNFEKLSLGTRYQPLWHVALALVEGLSNDSISASAAINNLLREIEKVIKLIHSDGKRSLDQFEFEELIKNLLYYIAGSQADSPRIVEIKELFKLDQSLPQANGAGSGGLLVAGTDADAMRSVAVALTEEFSKVKEVFELYFNKQEESNEALKKVLPVFKQAADTLAMLGQTNLRKIVEKIHQELTAIANRDELASADELMGPAAKLLEVEGALGGGSASADGSPQSMDAAMMTAQETVLFECQNGLEQAKDAIVEYIASQWDSKHISPLPALLGEIRGSLEMVSQRRSARVLGACSRYIKEKLIDGKHTPDWREMDTLADAIAGVEYYLETLDEDVNEDEDTVLAVAEESVANLGYAVTAHRKDTAGEDADDKKKAKLTKEKLAELVEAEKAAKAAEIAARKAAEEEARKIKHSQEIDTGPLMSDEEFNSIVTATDEFVIETDPNYFAGTAENKPKPKPEPPKAVEPVKEEPPIEWSPAAASDHTTDEDEIPLVTAVVEDVEAADEVPVVPVVEEEAQDIEFEEVVEMAAAPEEAEPLVAHAELASEPEPAKPVSTPVQQVAIDEDPGNLIIDTFGEGYDEEIAEIFIEEIQEVLAHIAEFYPLWKSSGFKDEASLKEFRRGFHTMKGSGRMAKALSVGELAWSVENMLNRVMDGTIKPDSRVTELVERVLAKVPSMMEAYSKKLPDPDPRLSRRYRLIGEALSKNEQPLPFEFSTSAAPHVVEPEPTETALAEFAETVVAAEQPADIDWELWEIFAAEADSHLAVADEWIAYAREQSPLPVDPTDPLQRALHTLKGSAYMAEINVIAELATPLEKFVKALRAFQIQVGDDFTNLLSDCVEEIRSGIQQIQARNQVTLLHQRELLTRINEMRLQLTGESEDDIAAEIGKSGTKPAAPTSAKVDPARFNQFLAEEMDSLMDAAEILEGWQQAEPSTDVERLCREVTSMADAAEPAGLMPITSLGRQLANAYNKVFAAHGAGREAFVQLANEAHEALINFVDELAGGQDIAPNTDLESRLQSFIDSEHPVEAVLPVEEVVEEIVAEEIVAEEPAPAVSVEEPLMQEPEQIVVEEPEPAPAAVAAPAAKKAEVQLLDPADFDSELLEIFIEEAAELLEELDTIIGSWHDDPSDRSQADALKRTLHTYKGGARMAGLSVLGTLAHDLETQLELFNGVADEGLFQKVHDYQDRLIKGTDRARSLMAGQAVGFDDLAFDEGAAIEAEPAHEEFSEMLPEESAYEDVPVPSLDEEPALEPVSEVAEMVEPEHATEETVEADAPVTEHIDAGTILEYSSDIDPDLLGIFIEEAAELLEDLDRGISEWQQEPDNRSFVDSLKRTLHTLKGGARMAGLTGLGTLGHDLETYLETFSGTGDEALFAMLHDYQDRIIRGVDQAKMLAAGETPKPAPVQAPVSQKPDQPVADVIPIAPQPRVAAEAPVAAEAASRPAANVVPFKAGNLPRGMDQQADKLAAAEQAARAAAPQEMVKIAAELVDQLVNLAGETSITRGRVEQQVIDFALTLNDVESTIKRMQDLLRRMEIETEAQVQSKIEEIQSRKDDFDPLEMDRYSTLQQLTRSLMETSSDLIDLRSQLTNKVRETEMILLQQSRINTELQEGLMRSRMVPFSRMVPRLRRIVRQVSGELKKDVDFDLVNVEGEMDRTVLERMVAPLEHMLRNALDHGIEMPAVREKAGKSRRGYVVLSFGREGGDVVITLKDDGGGIPVDKVRKKAIEKGLITEDTQLSDHEITQFIMHAGFSTAEKVTQISGRGVGMDVVHSEIKQLGGTVTINSQYGKGTEFVVRLPFTVSVNRALMIKTGDDQYAVPLNSIEGIVRVSPFELENYYQDKTARFEYAGELYEVRYLGELLQTRARPNLDGLVLPEPVILVRGADHSLALHVDQLLGSREIVVKSLGPQFGGVPGLSGATILGDGSVVVILDLMALVRATILLESQQAVPLLEQEAEHAKEVFTVMVVDDSVTVRKVTSRFLEREGFEVVLAKDGADAMLQLQDIKPDIMLLDIEMPRMDGFEVATSVKNSERLRDIPIIMITSRTGDKHRERALGIGVERYMGKPFVEEELLQTINTLIAEKIQKSKNVAAE